MGSADLSLPKTKIVVVLEATLGGIRKHVVDLISGLDVARYHIVFVYSVVRADETFVGQLAGLKSKGIELVQLGMLREVRPILDLKALVRLIQILRNVRPQILYLHGAKAGGVGRIAAFLFPAIRCVYNPHGGSFHKFKGAVGMLYRVAERLLGLRTQAFIGVSKDSCDRIKKTLNVGAGAIHLVYNGIDFARLNPAMQEEPMNRPDMGFAQGRFVVLHPALFLETKGHLQFIEGMARYPLKSEILFVLAGDGPLRDQIVMKIAKCGLQPHFHLLSYLRNLAPYYELCDMVILPSLAEALPYVLLEAMAYSKPVFASRVGGIPEVISDGYNGRLVDPTRMRDVGDMVNYYVEHRDELRAMGANGRRLIEQKFSLRQMIHDTDVVLQGLLTTKG